MNIITAEDIINKVKCRHVCVCKECKCKNRKNQQSTSNNNIKQQETHIR
ncbi:MAG: hypothetical protein IJ301_00440 [Clostridia bacterium]|nr:hypothetical protein [Clostridia bacterium]